LPRGSRRSKQPDSVPVRPPLHRLRASIADAAPFRGSAASRGYDGAWRRFRAGFLLANPLCADCARNGFATAATEVHHVMKLRRDPSLRLDARNAMALCKPCHSARTAKGE